MGKINKPQHTPAIPTPEEIIQLELQRLVRMNDAQQARAADPLAVGAIVIEQIQDISYAILKFGAHMKTIDPEIYRNEARRLHAVNEKLEPLAATDTDWIRIVTDNAVVLARLLDEAAIAATHRLAEVPGDER